MQGQIRLDDLLMLYQIWKFGSDNFYWKANEQSFKPNLMGIKCLNQCQTLFLKF